MVVQVLDGLLSVGGLLTVDGCQHLGGAGWCHGAVGEKDVAGGSSLAGQFGGDGGKADGVDGEAGPGSSGGRALTIARMWAEASMSAGCGSAIRAVARAASYISVPRRLVLVYFSMALTAIQPGPSMPYTVGLVSPAWVTSARSSVEVWK